MKSADHINIDGFKHVSYHITALSEEEAVTKSESYFNKLNERRSVRDYSDKWIPKKIIDNLVNINELQYLKFRDILYDIFIYNLDILLLTKII